MSSPLPQPQSDFFSGFAPPKGTTPETVSPGGGPDFFAGFKSSPRAIADAAESPDEAGKALNLSKESKHAPEVILPDTASAEIEAKQRAAAEAAMIPSVSKYMETAPLGTQVSNDDWVKLSTIDRLGQSFTAPLIWDAIKDEFHKQTRPVIAAGEQIGDVYNLAKRPMLGYRPEDKLPFIMEINPAMQMAKGVVGAADLVFRLMEAIPRAGGAFAGETITQQTGQEATGRRMQRDVRMLLETALNLAGAQTFLPPHRMTLPKPKERAAISPEAQRAYDEGNVPRLGLDQVADQLHELQLNLDSSNLDKLYKGVQESSTVKRSPDSAAQFLDGVVGEKEIFIPMDKVLEIYAARSGETAQLGSATDGVFGYVPDLVQQLELARESGGDIAIPLKDFLARTDPKVYEEVKESIRFRKEGVTKEEFAEFKELEAERQREMEAFDAMDAQREAAAAGEPKVEAAPEAPVTFQTAKGSTYEVHPDGTTTRTKAARDEPGHEGDVGLKEQSAKTYYAPADSAQALAIPQEATWRIIDHGDGTISLAIKNEKGEWGISPSARNIPVSDKPNVGTIPIEVWKPETVNGRQGYGKVHFGNEIVSMGEPKAAPTPAEAVAAEAVASEKRALFLDKYFEEGKAVGVTQTEFKQYSRKVEAADAALLEKVEAARLREMKRPMTEEWKKDSAEIEAEVIADLKSRPDLAADTFLRTGELPTGEKLGRVYLDREAVELELGKGRLASVTQKGGMAPDELAGLLNYKTGKELLRDLDLLYYAREAANETPNQYLKRVIADETEVRMFQKHGTLEKRLADAVNEAVMSAERLEVLAEEMKMLATAAKAEMPLSKEFLIDRAKSTFAETPVGRVSYEALRRETEKSGRMTERAMLKGNFPEAFQWKQRQFLSLLQAKEAKVLQKEIIRNDKLIKRLREKTIKSMDQEFLDMAHLVLEATGEGTKRHPDELFNALEGKSLESFVEQQFAKGWDIRVPDFLTQPTGRNTGKIEDMIIDTQKLTTEQYRQLNDFLRQLHHAGKESKLIDVAGKKVEFEAVKEEILDRITQLPQRAAPRGNVLERVGYGADALIVKPEGFLESLDLGKLGPVSKYIFRVVKEAQLKESQMTREVGKQLKALKEDKDFRKGLGDYIPNDVMIDPWNGQPYNLKRENLLYIALNFGNRSNINAIVRSNIPGEAGVMDMAAMEFRLRKLLNDNMRKSDWDFVQGIGDIFKSMEKGSDDLQRSMTGVGMVPIRPEAFTTPHGDYAGWYFPLIYDRGRGTLTEVLQRAEGPFEEGYNRPATQQGHLITRKKNVNQPIMIERTADHIASRLNQHIHDITTRRAVVDAWKIISDPDISMAIRKHYGPEYSGLLPEWVKDFANRNNTNERAISMANYWMGKLRGNITVQALGFNWNVIASPGTAKLFFSPKYMATAAKLLARQDYRYFDSEFGMAFEKSLEMRETMANLDRDFRQSFDTISNQSKWSAAQQWAAWKSMQPAMFVERFTRTVTWTTEYKKALAEGLPDADAVFSADMEVRRMHGATSIVDLSALFRSKNEFVRVFTMFQTYLNTIHNWQRQLPRHIREKEFAEVYGVIMGTVAIQTLFTAGFFAEKKPDESFGGFMGRSLLLSQTSLWPIMNILGQAVLEGHRPQDFLSGTISRTITGAKDVGSAITGDPMSKRWLANFMNLPGVFLGYPTGQAAKTTQFLYDVQTRKQMPMSFWEYVHGLRTGRARETKK